VIRAKVAAMPLGLYALLCVLVPCAIGVTMYGLFELWERHRQRGRLERERPVIDYLI
jgi:hypothetical protein